MAQWMEVLVPMAASREEKEQQKESFMDILCPRQDDVGTVATDLGGTAAAAAGRARESGGTSPWEPAAHEGGPEREGNPDCIEDDSDAEIGSTGDDVSNFADEEDQSYLHEDPESGETDETR